MDTISEAFQAVKREDFLPPAVVEQAQYDVALPIGYDQTNSQPCTVRSMLEWLDAQPGDRVLDIGSGSGWTTALLSHIVGTNGWVYAVELVPELVEFGRQNCNKLGIKNVSFNQASKRLGLPKQAPYERILVSASAREFPKELLGQLAVGGKLVVLVGENIQEVYRVNETKYERLNHPGYVFVPLLETEED